MLEIINMKKHIGKTTVNKQLIPIKINSLNLFNLHLNKYQLFIIKALN